MDGLKRFFHKTLASEFWEIGNDLKKDPWPLPMSWPRTATHLQRFWRLLKNQAISSTGRGFPFLFWCHNLKYISISISDLLQIQNSLATCKGTKTARSATCRVFRLCLWTLVWPVFSMITGARCLDVGPGHLQYHDNAFSAPSRCLQFPGVQIRMKIRTNPCNLMDMMDIIVVFQGPSGDGKDIFRAPVWCCLTGEYSSRTRQDTFFQAEESGFRGFFPGDVLKIRRSPWSPNRGHSKLRKTCFA